MSKNKQEQTLIKKFTNKQGSSRKTRLDITYQSLGSSGSLGVKVHSLPLHFTAASI